MMAMTQGGSPSFAPREYRSASPGWQVFLALACLTLILGMLGHGPAVAAPDSPDSQAVPQGPLDFESCVRLALQRSPYFIKSAIEIDIRRLDENDSRYSIFPPPITFRTYYYLNTPKQQGSSAEPYSLNFTMDPYNPVGSYLTLQAQKMGTQIAILAHMQVINKSLERLGTMFLRLATMKRIAALQVDQLKQTRENLVFAQNRLTIGTGTSLEVRVAEQELEAAKSEKERLEIGQKRLMTSLKIFLGLKPEQQVEFNLRDARRQVLGSFDPAAATLEQAKSRSYELKIMDIQKEMQGYRIAFAKARILPNILFNTQSPDPLSLTNNRGLFVGLGLEVPVWDGLKRIRDVSRQKAVLKQVGADKDLKENDLTDKWNTLQEDLKSSEKNLKFAQTQEELTRLKERQAEIRYQSGTEQLPSWLDARKNTLEAQKSLISKVLEHDESLLSLRLLSGDLGYTYVDPNSWKK